MLVSFDHYLITRLINGYYNRFLVLIFMFYLIFGVDKVSNVSDRNININHHVGDDLFFEIIEPSELEYTYRIIPARDFGAPFNSSFWLKHSKLIPMDPFDGCTKPKNYYSIYGNVAFAERGDCSFLHKTLIAEKVGAKAIIITEGQSNLSDVSDDDYIEMIADKSGVNVKIPAAFLLGKSGIFIFNTLKKLNMDYAIINLPINMTFVPINKMNQPPWVSW